MKNHKSTDMTWEQLHSIDDLNTVSEFLTERQTACLIFAQESDSSLLQLLLTDGYTNDFSHVEGFQNTQYAEWLDTYFSATPTETLLKCACIASMRNSGIDPFEPEAA